MLSREERTGLVWISLSFFTLVGGATLILFYGLARPTPALSRKVPAGMQGLGLGSVSGQVVHALTGEALRAEVRIKGLESIADIWGLDDESRPAGWFGLAGVPADTPFEVTIEAPDFEAATLRRSLAIGEHVELGDIALRPLVHLHGAILDAGGETLDGASIRVEDLESGESFEVAANKQGTFALDDLLPGTYQLIPRRPGHVGLPLTPVSLRDGGEWRSTAFELYPAIEVDARLETDLSGPFVLRVGTASGGTEGKEPVRLACLEGTTWLRVEQPERGIRVDLPIEAHAGPVTVTLPPTRELTLHPPAGATGLYCIIAAQSRRGPHRLQSTWQGRDDADATLRVCSGEATVVLGVRSDGAFFQRIQEADSAECTPRWLASAEQVAAPAGMHVALLADDEGRIGPPTAIALPPGFVLPVHPGVAIGRTALLPSAWMARHPELRAEDPPSFRCRLVTQGGRPLAATRVTLELQGAEGTPRAFWTSTWTRGDGELTLPRPPAGLRARLVAEPFAAALFQTELSTPLPTELALPPAATLHLRVEDESGNPLPGVRVTVPLAAAAGPGLPDELSWTSEKGVAALRNLPAGRYPRILLERAGWWIAPLDDLDLRAGELRREAAITAYRLRTLVAAIESTQAADLEGARVTLHSERSGEVRTTQTDADGRLEFTALPPPPYVVRILHRGHEETAFRVDDLGAPLHFRLTPLP